MPRLADATAYLKTDDKEFKAGLRSSQSEAEGWGSRMGSVMQGVGMSIGMGVAGLAVDAGRQVVGFISGSIDAASDLGETFAKTGELFGDSADEITAFAATAAQGLGQSKQQAMDAAATFATFGRAAGLAGDDLVGFSTGFVGLASDLASFNNTTPEQAINAIGAALRGESEPLRAYGVLLDDASMRQKALELGLIETTKNALTPQQKVLAAQALIYEQTTAAQGDFARTSDGLANKQRIVNAELENMRATVGEALLPVQLAFMSALSDLLTTVMPPLADFIANTLVPAMSAIANVLRATVGPAIEWIGGLFDGMGGKVSDAEGKYSFVSGRIETIMGGLRTIVDNVLQAISGFWERNGEAIKTIVGNWLGIVETIFRTTLDVILGLVEFWILLLSGDFEGAGETLKGIVTTLWDGIREIFRLQLDTIRTLVTDIDWAELGRNIIEGIANGISGAVGVIANAARDAARSAYEAAKSWLGISSPSRVAEQRIGKPFAQGIAAGIEEELRAITAGVGSGLNGMMGGLAMQTAPAAAGAPISITINMTGGADGAQAARSGVLSALRQAGLA